MTMAMMDDYLKNRGFEVDRDYDPKLKKYRFTITKDEKTLTKYFLYPPVSDAAARDVIQKDFLNAMVDEFEKASEEEKKMSNNNIKWKVEELSYDGTNCSFEAVLRGCMNGTFVGNQRDIVYDLNKRLKSIDEYSDFGKYVAYDLAFTKEVINKRFGTGTTITKVIFNDPATIVLWADGTKTVVKCQDCDTFDPEKGLAMAIVKKTLGNEGNYFNEIKKWTEKYDESSDYPKIGYSFVEGIVNATNAIRRLTTEFKQTVEEKRKHDDVWLAYQRLQNALGDKKATKADLKAAMEDASNLLSEWASKESDT